MIDSVGRPPTAGSDERSPCFTTRHRPKLTLTTAKHPNSGRSPIRRGEVIEDPPDNDHNEEATRPGLPLPPPPPSRPVKGRRTYSARANPRGVGRGGEGGTLVREMTMRALRNR